MTLAAAAIEHETFVLFTEKEHKQAKQELRGGINSYFAPRPERAAREEASPFAGNPAIHEQTLGVVE